MLLELEALSAIARRLFDHTIEIEVFTSLQRRVNEVVFFEKAVEPTQKIILGRRVAITDQLDGQWSTEGYIKGSGELSGVRKLNRKRATTVVTNGDFRTCEEFITVGGDKTGSFPANSPQSKGSEFPRLENSPGFLRGCENHGS